MVCVISNRGTWGNLNFEKMRKNKYCNFDKFEIENGSILLALQIRHILASLDSVVPAADGIKKEA